MKRILLVLALLLTPVFLIPSTASAQGSADAAERWAAGCAQRGGTWDGSTGTCTGATCASTFLGLPAWFKYLDQEYVDGRCTVTGPTHAADIPHTPIDESAELNWPVVAGRVALAISEAMLQIAALVAVGFTIYGGFNYITSQGDPEKAKSARQYIINAMIGLVITMAASGIVRFVGWRLTS